MPVTEGATRREFLLAAAALAACGPRTETRGDVFAAGQPAAILVLALAPERLLGWPRRPAPGALALLPPTVASLPELGALTGGGAPASLERVASLGPALILDYGDVETGYRGVEARIRTRIETPYHLIDGTLARTPQALVEVGRLLGVEVRAARLAGIAEGIVSRWQTRAVTGPSFYYARGRDGLETGFAGALATEVLEGAGWRNVAVGSRDIGRVSGEQLAAWDPEVLVTLDAGFARAAVSAPLWNRRTTGGARRILLLPELPYGWIDRPPSINRLLGCAWFAGGLRSDAAAAEMVARFARDFYGTELAVARRALLPRWVA